VDLVIPENGGGSVSDERAGRQKRAVDETAKDGSWSRSARIPTDQYMTTNQGVRVNHDDDSLKAGPAGPR
jgi:catalase